jgi:hypothetical protein
MIASRKSEVSSAAGRSRIEGDVAPKSAYLPDQ